MLHFHFTLHQLPIRVALLFLLIFSSFKWVMADAPPRAATTAPKALTSCRPTFSSGCFTGGLNSFTVNGTTLSNATSCSTGYAAYTAVTTNVAPGQPHPFAGTFTNSGYPNGVTIWADVNRDGTFGTTEVVFQASTVTTSTFSGSLTIPLNTATGPVDVRVVVAYFTIPPSSSACGSFSYGEAEDYVLNVIAPTAYYPTTTNIANTSALLNWNNLGTASSYEVQWRPQTTPASAYTTISGITSTTFALTGLGIGAYEWQMRPTSGTYVGPVSFTVGCTTPSNLNAFNVGSASVQFLSWSAVSEPAYPNKTYEVQLQVKGAGSWSTVYTGTNTLTPRISGLSLQTPYTWRVRADCSLFSAPQTFTTTCNTPSLNGAYNIAHNSAQLLWSDPEGGVYVLQYRPAGGTWTTVSSLTTTSYDLTGLTNNTTYECAVSKVCATTLSSPYSATRTFTTACKLLSSPGTTELLPTSAVLYWYNYAAGVPPGEVQLQWRPTSQSVVSWTTIDNIPGGIYTSYSLTGLTNNTAYQWQARASCGAGVYSSFTSPISFTTQSCQPPSALNTSSIGINRATLSWNSGSYLEQRFTVQYRPASLSTTTSGWTSVTGIVSDRYSLTGLDPNTAYQWQVSMACTPTELSGFSAPLIFSTLPCNNRLSSTPFATNQTYASAQLNWSDRDINTYTVQWRPQSLPASNWNTIANAVTGNGGSYTLTGLNTSTTYEWQVAVVCTPSLLSNYFGGNSFTTTACSNLATGLAATGTTFSAANLTWTGPTFVPYVLRYRPIGTTTWTDVSGIMTKPYTLTGLMAGTVYEAQIASVCSGSATAYGLIYSFTTAAACTNAASSLTALSVGSTTATLGWASPPGIGSSLRYRVAGAVGWQTVVGVVNAPYALTNLIAGTAYEFQVASVCGPGQLSGYTAPASFTTTSTNTCPLMVTVQNGDWTNPAIWSCNRVPLATDPVQVLHIVTIPNNGTGRAQRLSYGAGGKVSFGMAARLLLNQ